MLRIQSMKFEVNIQYTAVVVMCDRLVHRFSLSSCRLDLRECITKRYTIIYLKKDVSATAYNVIK